jgi:hypothetical protein
VNCHGFILVQLFSPGFDLKEDSSISKEDSSSNINRVRKKKEKKK